MMQDAWSWHEVESRPWIAQDAEAGLPRAVVPFLPPARFCRDCGLVGLDRGSGLLLALHLRQALFQRGHEIDDRGQFLRLLDRGNFATFEFGFD